MMLSEVKKLLGSQLAMCAKISNFAPRILQIVGKKFQTAIQATTAVISRWKMAMKNTVETSPAMARR